MENESENIVSFQDISPEELKENSDRMQTAKDVLTPPEGQVLAGLRSFCPIHGDITRASKLLKHTIYKKNTESGEIEPVSYTDVLCLACLSELWRTQVVAKFPKNAEGKPEEIKVAPVFIAEKDYKEILVSQTKEQVDQLKKQIEDSSNDAALQRNLNQALEEAQLAVKQAEADLQAFLEKEEAKEQEKKD